MVLIKNKLPSQRKLKEDFRYNAATGSFIRYDDNFGYINSKGYCYISYEGAQYMAHRLIWKWWYGYDPEEIDHINGDKLDNRINNLRNVDRKTNNKNSKKRKDNSSGFQGVTWHTRTNKWRSRVTIDKKQIAIGYYNSPQEAADARDSFIKEFYPDHFTERHGK